VIFVNFVVQGSIYYFGCGVAALGSSWLSRTGR
jgi:hypothetical protein